MKRAIHPTNTIMDLNIVSLQTGRPVPIIFYQEVCMKKSLSVIALLLLVGSPLLSSCSKGQESKEQGVIEQHNDKVAADAVKMMKTPVDQAKKAAEQETGQSQEMEKQIGTQQ
jgi:hypothetical protein